MLGVVGLAREVVIASVEMFRCSVGIADSVGVLHYAMGGRFYAKVEAAPIILRYELGDEEAPFPAGPTNGLSLPCSRPSL